MYDPELPAGYQDADFEQAELERAGNESARALRLARKLYEKGHTIPAADTCPHGWGYDTNGTAAEKEHDPHAGTPGFRCYHCGSYWAPRLLEPAEEDHRDRSPDEPCSYRPFGLQALPFDQEAQ